MKRGLIEEHRERGSLRRDWVAQEHARFSFIIAQTDSRKEETAQYCAAITEIAAEECLTNITSLRAFVRLRFVRWTAYFTNRFLSIENVTKFEI